MNYYRRGYCFLQINRFKESASDFVKAANLNYRPCDSFYSLALMYSTIFANDSLAAIYCKKCLEVDPDYEDVKKLLPKLKKHGDGFI